MPFDASPSGPSRPELNRCKSCGATAILTEWYYHHHPHPHPPEKVLACCTKCAAQTRLCLTESEAARVWNLAN